MPREYPDYRPNIEHINSIFPGRLELRVEEIAKALGRTPRTIYDRYGQYIVGGSIPVTTLARAMCPEEQKKRKRAKV